MAETEQMDFLAKFMATNHVPEDALKHFASIPWTNTFLQNPLYKAVPTFSRVLKPTGEDYFFSRTIWSPSTIPYLISLQLNDFPELDETPRDTQIARQSHAKTTPVPANPDVVILIKLGSPGLDGHPHVIHGGVSCAILDEMMGLCVMLHHLKKSGPRDSLFTVSLNVTYRAPVPTPSEIVVRSWLTARQGRKSYTIGQIVDKDGVVLTEGEGIWVSAKRQEKL